VLGRDIDHGAFLYGRDAVEAIAVSIEAREVGNGDAHGVRLGEEIAAQRFTGRERIDLMTHVHVEPTDAFDEQAGAVEDRFDRLQLRRAFEAVAIGGDVLELSSGNGDGSADAALCEAPELGEDIFIAQ